MKLSYGKWAKLEGMSFAGAWLLLSGPEERLKREALARLRAEARERGAGEEVSWETIDGRGASAREVLNRCHTGSLFGGARVLVVREAERMPAGQQEELARGVGPLPEGVSVVLMAGEREGRRRGGVVAALARAIAERGIVIEFPSLGPAEAAQWAIARAKELGKRLEPAAARKLAEQKIGTDLGDLEQEVEKLALFVGDLDLISVSHVDEVTPRLIEEDVFRLIDALERRSAGRAVAIVRELTGERREPPERILGMLARSMRLVWQAKVLLERGWRPAQEVDEESAALLPQDPRKNARGLFARQTWQAKRAATQASAMSWGRLAKAMRALHECDLALKGIEGNVSDGAVAIELLVEQLCADFEMPRRERG